MTKSVSKISFLFISVLLGACSLSQNGGVPGTGMSSTNLSPTDPYWSTRATGCVMVDDVSAKRGIPASLLKPNALMTSRIQHSTLLKSVSGTTLPAAADNSQLSAFPPVGDQGGIGSCVSFAVGYYQFSHEVALATGAVNSGGTAVSGNTIFSPKWIYNFLSGGVPGSGSTLPGNFILLKIMGSALYSDFPYGGNANNTSDYLEWCTDQSIAFKALQYRLSDYYYLPVDETGAFTQWKTLLAAGHIISFDTYVYSWNFVYLKNNTTTTADDAYVGEYGVTSMTGYSGAHAMTIVGYNDNIWIDVNGDGTMQSSELGAFKVANSWGTGWCNGGFVWLSYDALLSQSAIYNPSGRMSAIRSAYTITVETGIPSYYVEYTVTTADRYAAYKYFNFYNASGDYSQTMEPSQSGSVACNFSGGTGSMTATYYNALYVPSGTLSNVGAMFTHWDGSTLYTVQSLRFVNHAEKYTNVFSGTPYALDSAYETGLFSVSYSKSSSSSSSSSSFSSSSSSSSSQQSGNGYISVQANGDVKYSFNSSERKDNVMVFAKQNGVQNVASDITSSVSANADGSYTYSYTRSASLYAAGDVLVCRFYTAKNGVQQFIPGTTDSVWSGELVYGQSSSSSSSSSSSKSSSSSSSSVSSSSSSSSSLSSSSSSSAGNTYMRKLSSGNVRFSVTYSESKEIVMVFAKQNGIQNLAVSIVANVIANGDGTYTYYYDGTGYNTGDVLVCRFYSAKNGIQLFTPGPAELVWSDSFKY